MTEKPVATTSPSEPLPAAILVLYDERQGLSRPSVRLFNAAADIEAQVNDWIRSEPDIVVHRVDWLPSGGRLGASVTYSKGTQATQTLRLPTSRSARPGPAADAPLVALGNRLMLVGVALGIVALAMYAAFYPVTWYNRPGALMDGETAIKATILAAGVALILLCAGLGTVMRSRSPR